MSGLAIVLKREKERTGEEDMERVGGLPIVLSGHDIKRASGIAIVLTGRHSIKKAR